MSLVRIASDWHLEPGGPPAHARLARTFLAEARRDGATVILNGDVFEDLFAGAGRGERAHPEVVAEVEALRALGRLRRTRGNHDPDGGEDRVVLDWPGLGRILVTHGHTADPVNRSAVGRLGDGISRRFGRLRLVRGAAGAVETVARALAGRRLEAVFRARCLALLASAGCDVGVFGHLHAAHLRAGDPYVNSGCLAGGRLEYAELGPDGLRLRALTTEALASGTPPGG
jgi:UDP-2,3-diacylglucosamine pyrophosphatase LpxH